MIDVTDGYVTKKNLEIQSSRLTTLLERFPAGVWKNGGQLKLPNRRSFMAMLARRLASQGGATPHGALLMLDIDHFKKVNDTYGHPVGDLVLQQMAQVMRQSLRADDYAARLGGEEFVVLLHQTTLEESRLLAERLRECVASQPTDAGEAGMIAITVSIGLVELAGQESQMALEHADKALYAAKAGGRNLVCIATTD